MSLTPISHLRDEVISLYEAHGSYLGAAVELSEKYSYLAKPNQLRSYIKTEVKFVEPDYEVLEETVRLAKSHQRLQDQNRIKNKSFREYARIENAIASYNEAIVSELKELGHSLRDCDHEEWLGRKTSPLDLESASLVIHISDNHFNELVNLPTNRFDFEVAAKRLALLAQKTKRLGKAYGVERIVIFFGGDLLNSDRRLDELLSMSTNRARATLLAVHLYKQFLVDLRLDFFIDCFGVTGNESRVKDDLGWVDLVATDSYDFTIYAMLQAVFEATGDDGFTFHEFQANDVVFKVHGQTFLGIHGHQINATDQKKVQAMIGKYAAKGVKINHILCGHIHCSMVSDYVSRNASLVGSNAYSEEALGFVSKAAQNIHIVTPQGLDGVKCDLQNVEGIKGYEIIERLAAYNARSAEKAGQSLRDPETLVRVVI